MPEPSQLLYLLSDAAYLASLIPGKKDHTFEIHNYRQINGTFLNEQGCLSENIDKLFGKIANTSIELILPDHLFTNTIVEVDETSEAKVKEVIKTKLLPDLGLNQETHLLKPFILNQYANKSRVQLTALEKKVIAPIVKAANEHSIKVGSIVPLSWTLKSLISLEPSICVVQFQNQLQLALHYIGIDQTSETTTKELDKLVETIKTLKGSQSSIQTVYLLSDSTVEKELEKLLGEGLPIQQLVSDQVGEQIPASIQLAIESGMKTLSIEEYSIPAFDLPKIEDVDQFLEAATAKSAQAAEATEADETDEAEKADDDAKADDTPADEVDSQGASAALIPPPTVTPAGIGNDMEAATELDLETEPDSTEEIKEESIDDAEPEKSPEPDSSVEAEVSPATPELTTEEPAPAKPIKTDFEDDKPSQVLPTIKEEKPMIEETKTPEPVIKNDLEEAEQESDTLAGFAKTQEDNLPVRKVIKNNSGISPVLKVLFIGLAVFFTTIAVGLGAGMLFLNWFQSPSPEPTPVVVEVEESETPEPTPEPIPDPADELDVSELSGLVVNATTRAGFAGQVETALETGDFESIAARNARGEYDTGTYLLVATDDADARALKAVIEDLTGYTVEISTEKTVEDATDQFDFVVVLADPDA